MGNMLALIGATRRKCGHYAPQDGPDEGIVAEFILEVLDEANTELSLSVPTWYLPRFPITVSPGLDETPIASVGDFGRPYMVLTAPSTSSAYNSRVVDIVDASALYRYYGGGDSSQAINGSNNTSWGAACAFTYHDGQHWFQVGPVPTSSADYLALYEPETVRPARKEDEAFRLPQFDSLISDKAALRILPYIKMGASQKGAIASTLTNTIAQGEVRFRRFRQSDRNNDRVTSIPFGAWRWRRGAR
jgi:hypothetical protein